jgi:uncharacterized membrane protein
VGQRASVAGMTIGFGMGGLLDFLLLHLILQWHHMISSRVPPVGLEALQENIFWDGIGQAAMWIIVFAGVFFLLGAARNSGGLPSALPTRLAFLGYFVIGWGVFNFLDGVVNHHLLGLHNVREDVPNVMAWNLGFLLVAGILLPLAGWWMVRAGQKEPEWA